MSIPHTRAQRNRSRMITGAALAAVLAGAGTVLGAPPAAAADAVTVGYTCTGPGAPGGVQSLLVTVTAPAGAPQGSTADLSVEVTTALTVPIDVPARAATGEMTLELGGAATGSVTAAGFTNAATVPSGSTVTLTGGTASVGLPAAGAATVTPGTATVHVFGVTVTCQVSGTAPVAATIDVT
ncbi:hypothetical protein [Streptomyces nondiastaticus]|uniref:Uncharacterized protein n=1 Tax=Streptomyces nondiastaticus TaxID=3154512 RepID=A0ABW6U625_9ACTN